MKKGLLNVLISNIIYLCVNLIINFLIPKYVSIDTYSLIKTYTLYLSYAGVLHFGYNDGMYLKYGGKNINEIDKKDLANNFFNYVILNFVMFCIIFIVSLIIKNDILFAFSFGMFSCNIMSYLKLLYQATGNFKLYGIALNLEKVSIFLLTIIALFVLKSDNYIIFIWIQIIVGIISTFIVFYGLEKKLKFIKYGRFKISEYIDNIKSGFILLIGNFSNSFFTTMDRWFIKVLLDSSNFAMYSFAASMENIINVFISPITITMYNYFCKKITITNIIKVKNISLIYGFLVIAAAYPAKFILENFLTNYINSSKIVFLLFGTQLFYVIIKGIYINLYKSRKQQKLYLKQMLCMVIIGFSLNIILFKMFKNTISIAIATFITSIIWLIICEIKEKKISFNIKEILAIIIIIFTYLYTGFKYNSIIGFIIYFIITIITCFIFLKETILYLFNLIKKNNLYLLIKNNN